MTGNHAPGFDGFRSRLEAMVEALGGDEPARQAARYAFAEALEDVQRADRHARRADGPPRASNGPSYADFIFSDPHRGAWLTATPGEFDRAATGAESGLSWHSGEEVGSLSIAPGVRIAWTRFRVARLFGAEPDVGLPLAARRGASLSMTETGLRVVEFNGWRPRSRHREFGSPAAAEAALARLAAREFSTSAPER